MECGRMVISDSVQSDETGNLGTGTGRHRRQPGTGCVEGEGPVMESLLSATEHR